MSGAVIDNQLLQRLFKPLGQQRMGNGAVTGSTTWQGLIAAGADHAERSQEYNATYTTCVFQSSGI